MRGNWFPLGLDLETTGLDPNEATILSVGAYDFERDRSFYEEIRLDYFQGNPAAFRVNGFDVTKLDNPKNSLGAQRLRMDTCDIAFAKWLSEAGYENEGGYKYIPVGKNIGSMDMQFLKKYMPKSRAKFGHRFIDINSIVFMESKKMNFGFKAIRRQIMTQASIVLKDTIAEKHNYAKLNRFEDFNFGVHNALFDAMEAAVAFELLTSVESFKDFENAIANLEEREENRKYDS